MWGARLIETISLQPDVDVMIFELRDLTFIAVAQPRTKVLPPVPCTVPRGGLAGPFFVFESAFRESPPVSSRGTAIWISWAGLTPMWTDRRIFSVPGVDPDACRAITKTGYTIWPPGPPNAKGKYEGSAAGAQTVRLRFSESGAANDAIT